MSTVRKALAALLTGLLAWATAITVSPSATVTASEWITGVGVCVAAFLTWLVPNTSSDDPVDLNETSIMP